MNSLQIEKILKCHYATRKNFLGCFAADELTSILVKSSTTFPFCVVANTDLSSSPGEHWVALYAHNPTLIEYFDSLAEPPNEHIGAFLANFKEIIKNDLCLQNPFTNVCGQFCIYFIVKRSLGISFTRIVNFLYKMKNTDNFVKNFVIMLIS